MQHFLSNFRHIRPHHEIEQEKILDWIAEAHARAANHFETLDIDSFRKGLSQKLLQLGVGKEKIQRRGIHISDLFQKEWENMEIYSVTMDPKGKGFTERSDFYEREVLKVFENFYPDEHNLPEHLIHVTCTGYVAPSPAQRIVSMRNAGMKTTVTHAYHMGCYGSIPAIRMAAGFASAPNCGPTDIIHTEVCSLHMHPLKHSAEQLIVQSLFADGFIKYTLNAAKPLDGHLQILASHEETIPDSSHCMTWRCETQGLSMTLSKEVPVRIARAIGGYLNRLCKKGGLDDKTVLQNAYFAIHPGGPKIVQQIQDLLKLELRQIEHSVQVLKECGNMSSATLPHIWERMLQDTTVPNHTQIVSLAFGPGLSISGAIFEKGC